MKLSVDIGELFYNDVFGMANFVRGDGMSCGTNPDTHRVGEPYFKVLSESKYSSAENICRISFLEPRYITHSNANNGKKNYTLNSDERKTLDKLLKRLKFGFSTYMYGKFCWNCGMGMVANDIKNFTEFINYSNGLYDEQYADNPNYLPSTLEMPDYRYKLP